MDAWAASVAGILAGAFLIHVLVGTFLASRKASCIALSAIVGSLIGTVIGRTVLL